MPSLSIVQYCGPHEGGSCGYCRSTALAKAKDASRQVEEGASESPSTATAIEDDDEDTGGSYSFGKEAKRSKQAAEPLKKVNFGLWAHSLSHEAYNALLDRNWRRSGCYLYKPTLDKTCCPQYTIRLDVHKFVLSRTQKRVLKEMADFLRGKAGKKKTQEAKHEISPEALAKAQTDLEEARVKQENQRRPPGGKRKAERRERAIAKWKSKGLDVEAKQLERLVKAASREKSLEERIDEGEGGELTLKIRLVRASPPCPDYEATKQTEFALYEKYQKKVHKDDKTSYRGYENFLVSTPMAKFRGDADKIEPDLGSYHQQYWLGEQLLAVGVVDILPRCISSKYMFYDPDYPKLNLGTYTALREIAFVRSLAKQRPDLHYYYMGFYIEGCPKMRYKGAFRPSDLLCDRTFKWVPLSECREMLKANDGKFTVFRPNDPALDLPSKNEIVVIYRGRAVTYGLMRQLYPRYVEQPEVAEELERYVETVGEASYLMALYLPRLEEGEAVDDDDDEPVEEEV